MKMKLWLIIMLTGLVLAACSTTPGGDDPTPSESSQMTIEDDHLDDPGSGDAEQAEEIDLDDDDISRPEDNDEMEPEDEDNTPTISDRRPPIGGWRMTHLSGTTKCENGVKYEIPALVPVLVMLGLSDDGKTMTLTTPDGTITLTQLSTNTEGENTLSSA